MNVDLIQKIEESTEYISQRKQKRLGKEGKVFYEKHKIFLYKEDFEKFTEGLKNAVTYIDNGNDVLTVPDQSSVTEIGDEKSTLTTGEFTNVEFEDLGEK